MENNVNELRKILFESIRGVKDGTLDIEKAKAVADMSQVIINSAKIEVDYIKATGGVSGSTFLTERENHDKDSQGYAHIAGNRNKLPRAV